MTKTQKSVEQQNRFKGILSRLRKDTSGVALYMYAIGLVPIMASAGIGFDIGRAYLVRSKMQQACDAGAIAGRRSMAGTVIRTEDKQEAERFFRANFQDKMLGSKPIGSYNESSTNKIDVWQSDSGQLYMSAKTQVPTTLVSQFVGEKDVDVSVKCLGEEFFVNTDIMMVLDTTGSMNCAIGASPICGSNDGEAARAGNASKMAEMRRAIQQMYADLRPIQLKLEQRNLRMRLGLVNYAMNANVGNLIFAENPNYIRPSYTYNNDGIEKEGYWDNEKGKWINATINDYITSTLNFSSSDTIGEANSRWNGCIEEPKTARISYGSSTIPSDAYDLNIKHIPNNFDNDPDKPDSRWALMPSGIALPLGTRFEKDADWQVVKDSAGNPITKPAIRFCPRPATHLQVWNTQAAFDARIDEIRDGAGGTHHDVGMLWGARMLSDQGIFGHRNPKTHNGVEVKKVIVFMTDGTLSIGGFEMSSYGVMNITKRTVDSTSGNDQKAVHRNRFNLACQLAKEQEIDIWVVAMLPSSDTGRNEDEKASIQTLRDCATVPSQMIFTDNTSELTNAFKSISDKVGNLRVGE
jgi:Flp pilus assembly protein TadG